MLHWLLAIHGDSYIVTVRNAPLSTEVSAMSTNKGTDWVRARIRRVMAVRGMKVARLAEETDMPYRTVQNYLLGKHAIPASALGVICEKLDVSADWILYGVGAQLNEELVKEDLSVVYDLAKFQKNVDWEQLGKIFIQLYNRDYAKMFPVDAQAAEGDEPSEGQRSKEGGLKR